MIDRKFIQAELQNIQSFFGARADMAIGDGKMKLLSWANACGDALELLKEQEPRVLTLEEVMKHYSLPPVFVDDINMQEDYLQDIQPLYFEFHCDLPWNVHWLNYNQMASIREGIKTRYGTIIRAWSARPTDEQRKAVNWDE